MQKENNKLGYISFMSVVSCVAVVMLHTNGCFWLFDPESTYWASANIIESTLYFAVPIFFMIPGVTLLDYRKRYDTKTFFKKRVNKTVIPFLVWSVIGLLVLSPFKEDLSLKGMTVKRFIDLVFNCKILSIYWFFIALFALYMCIPVLSAIPEEKRKEVYTYLVIVSVLFNTALPFVFGLADISYNIQIYVAVGTGYVDYLCAGYLLSYYEISRKKQYMIYLAGIAGLLAHIIGTYVCSIRAGEISALYKGYTNLPCFLYSMAIFLLFKNVGQKIQGKAMQIIKTLSNYTFGVYLMHWFIMEFIMNVFHANIYILKFRIGAAFVIAAICMAITAVVQKIPVLKRILP